MRAIRAAASAPDKIAIYAAAVGRIAPARHRSTSRIARGGRCKDPDCADLYARDHRATGSNMRLFVADLRATGELRDDLTDNEVADIVWSMNSAEYYLLLVKERGWTPARFGTHLADTWRRVLLASPIFRPYGFALKSIHHTT